MATEMTEMTEMTETTETTEIDVPPCTNPNGHHEPNWDTVHIDVDGDAYLDVNCRHCGKTGCLGSVNNLLDNLSWDDS